MNDPLDVNELQDSLRERLSEAVCVVQRPDGALMVRTHSRSRTATAIRSTCLKRLRAGSACQTEGTR